MGVEREHWEGTYAAKAPDRLSWYEPTGGASLELIQAAGLDPGSRVLDVGCGASSLAAELVALGYTDVTVADISAAALEIARAALGEDANRISWVQGDVRNHDFGRSYDLWHDRALFHFMVASDDRRGYLSTLRRTLRPGGHVVISAFGPDGPTRCSGLPVQRYDEATLAETLGREFSLISFDLRMHLTPSGRHQQFLYAHLRRQGVTG